MPYTKEQRALFNAAANDPQIAERHGMSHKEARRLANEANKLKGEGREKKSAAKRIETEPACCGSPSRSSISLPSSGTNPGHVNERIAPPRRPGRR